jgi:hypothetical protein
LIKKILFASVASLAINALASVATHGDTIQDLANTGAGVTDGQTDRNYEVVHVPAVDGPSAAATTVVGGGFPFPYWIDAPSGWNWLSAFGRDPNLDPISNGNYECRLSFFLTTHATVFTIPGSWAADNLGSDILLDGGS